MSELYAILTLQLGIAPDYVLDEMQPYEIKAVMENSFYRNKEGWEQARLLAYIMAQVNSRKTLTVESIMTFPWEKKQAHDKDNKVTREQLENLQSMAQSLIESGAI